METRTITRPAQEMQHRLQAKRWLMLIATLGATLMGAIDIFIVNVAVPTIERELHTGFAEIQLVIAGYTLAYAALLVTGGRLGDLYGRKRIFLLGVITFTLCSALCGFAPNAIFLISFRVIQGAAAALMTPQVISFIQVSFAPQERQTATSAYVVTLGLASILGLVLGGGLIVANILGMGWRSIFLINIPIGLLVLLATLLWVSESKAPGSQNLDYGGVTLLTLSLMLFTFALIMGGNTGWPLWSIICLVLSLPCIVAFWTYERWLAKRGKIALISPSLFRLRQFTAGNLTNLLDGTLWNGMLFLVSIYLQTTLHLSPLQSGLSMTVGSIAFIIASSANATLTRCLGRLRKRNLSIGAGMMAVSYLLFLLATKFLVAHGGVIPVLVAFFILCFSHGFFYTLVMPKTLEEVTTDHVGAASGIFTTTAAISSTFGVAIIGMIYAALTISYKNSLAAFELTMLLITLVSLGVIIFVQPLEASRSNISQ